MSCNLSKNPTNAYDVNAVKVLSKSGHQIGYLNRDLAEKVNPALRNASEIHVKASWVNGDKMIGVGIRIELVS